MIRFEHVFFEYPGQAPTLAGMSLSVEAGEVCAIVGRSGVGKTTLLKLVNRLLLPTSGVVSVEGRDTREWDPIRLRRQTGYVFQDVGLFPHLTVEENVSIVPRLEKWPATRVRGRAHELLDLLGLPAAQFGERRPRELSGGQRQRVGLARALAAHPAILLMDEPFGALDPLTRAEVRDAFAHAQAQLRTTVMMVTHDIAEAFALADRIGVVDSGVLLVFDTPSRVAASTDARVRAFVDAVPKSRWQ
ncbi:MAG: ATP-binding cassette domain-containing protein [Acidobacteriota bacterium]